VDTTRKYIVTTITGYVLLAVWLASVLADPLLKLDPAVQTAVFGIAIAALGLQTYSGYKATDQVATMNNDASSWG